MHLFVTLIWSNTSLVSVVAPSCIGEQGDEMRHISCSTQLHHLLNWLRTCTFMVIAYL